jgi:bacterioferritin
MAAKKIRTDKVIETLNEILEHEMAGVVRYTHFAMMSFGFARIPIVKWFDENAVESLAHARMVGDHVTNLGGHPSLRVGRIPTTHKHDIDTLLSEALTHELQAIDAYEKLLKLVEGKNIALEEFARTQVAEEMLHVAGMEKMLRAPGS